MLPAPPIGGPCGRHCGHSPLPAPEPPHLGLPEQPGGDALPPAEPSSPVPQHFRCTAGATPLASPGLQPPAEDEARAAEPDTDYENLRRSAGRWGETEGGKEGTAKEGLPGGTSQAGVEAQPVRAENEKDATTEKNKKRG